MAGSRARCNQSIVECDTLDDVKLALYTPPWTCCMAGLLYAQGQEDSDELKCWSLHMGQSIIGARGWVGGQQQLLNDLPQAEQLCVVCDISTAHH